MRIRLPHGKVRAGPGRIRKRQGKPEGDSPGTEKEQGQRSRASRKEQTS